MTFRFPHDVPGWLTEEEGQFLYKLADEGGNILEIGAYCGRSTICMAQNEEYCETVYTIDTFDGRATPTPGSTYLPFLTNLAHYGVLGSVVPYVGLASRIVPILHTSLRFNLVFVDAAHDYLSVMKDAELAWSVLNKTGRIAFHDYESPQDPEVTQAINYLISVNEWTLVDKVGTVAVLKPPYYNGKIEEEKA